jgi:biofilm PGA synthesis N-glycosyltransferase PgaC
VFSLLYLLLLAAVWVGLDRLKSAKKLEPQNVTVVIAARNEADRITACLNGLEKLEYPADKLEVILVDDCSSDRTPSLIRERLPRNKNWKLIELPEKSSELRGKKNALLQGIAAASGELILTTDADCVVPPGWVRKMNDHFGPGVSMVIGYSPLQKGKGFLDKLLRFDNLFSAISASAPTKLGYPFTSVGRNLGYRKDAYEYAGGFLALKKFRSGDDVHLTERFRYTKSGVIEYCADPDSFVITFPPATRLELFHQQVRKNSKTLKKAGTSVLFSLALFAYYILFAGLPFFLASWIDVWLVLLALKLITEYIDLRKAAYIFGQSDLIKYIPLMQVIYPAYIIFFSLLGVLQVYSWKK